MSYESISVHIAGENPTKKKLEILEAAKKYGAKSVSAFLIECFELVMSARRKKEERSAK